MLDTSLLKKKTTVSLQLIIRYSYKISHPHAIHFPHKTVGASTTYLVEKTNLIPTLFLSPPNQSYCCSDLASFAYWSEVSSGSFHTYFACCFFFVTAFDEDSAFFGLDFRFALFSRRLRTFCLELDLY
jgi:hypothetical protein